MDEEEEYTAGLPKEQGDKLASALGRYVGDVPRTDYLKECISVAWLSVNHFVGTAVIPPYILDRAVLEVAAELYHRKNAPNGIKSYADTFDGASAIRVARDALVAARPLLTPYMPLPIA